MTDKYENIVLGAGFSGLGVGYKTSIPVFEASELTGGICRSYHSKANFKESSHENKGFRFEVGGGHWIFDKNPRAIEIFSKYVTMRRYQKKSAVWIPSLDLKIPTPIQRHINIFPKQISAKIHEELKDTNDNDKPNSETLEVWLLGKFGPTLCRYFFFPFHEKYTAGLYRAIAHQDVYKTPEPTRDSESKTNVSYNDLFYYPDEGLDVLSQSLSQHAIVHYRKKAVKVDVEKRILHFHDQSNISYKRMISTIPLQKLSNLVDKEQATKDPCSSVLVINIGATRGDACPGEHWLYCPESKSGFHRVGFYSNVSDSFLPHTRYSRNLVSIYVEFGFLPENKPDENEVSVLTMKTISELKEWGFIRDVLVDDSNWIETAYTWRLPESEWVDETISRLKGCNIFSVGRFAEWRFQGLSKSFMDGNNLACRFKNSEI